jgi:pimeloyl-ACP methyl ester carboxylesterase
MLPVVLLPGMMCDARLWGPVSGAFAGRSVVHCALDVGSTTAEMAAQVLLRAPPRFALAGLSLGGIVAMEVLSQAADRVDRLALLDTNPLAETPAVAARRPAQMARALQGDLAGVMRDEMKPNYLAPGRDNRAVLDLCLTMALSLGPEVFSRQSTALATRPDRQAVLAATQIPALVLMGAEDRLCPLDRHQLMNRLLAGSKLVLISAAGHLPVLEQPVATARALADWLAN